MQLTSLSLLLGLTTLFTPTIAQTWTSCNPLNSTCPNDPALGIDHTFVFNTSSTVSTSWNITAGALNYSTSTGAAFTINKRYDSPTIQSQFYIFFGSVSVMMRAATGQGVISSIVLESDDLDEVDWELMGGNTTHAETNYFGKGNTTAYDRAIYYPVSSPQADFHNYTVDWTADRIEWMIDSVLVRTLEYADANGGKNFPQTPMTVRMGIWAGGDPSNAPGTIEWAGGLTNYADGPYTMYVQSATVNDYSTGSAYEYSDHTGDWQSIKVISGNSTIVQKLNATPPPTISQKFAALSPTAHVAVYSAGAGVAVVLLSVLSFCCIKQRKAGRREREREIYMGRQEKELENEVEERRMDVSSYQMQPTEKGWVVKEEGPFVGNQGGLAAPTNRYAPPSTTYAAHSLGFAPPSAAYNAPSPRFPLRTQSPGFPNHSPRFARDGERF